MTATDLQPLASLWTVWPEGFFFQFASESKAAAAAKYTRLQVNWGCCCWTFSGHPIFPLQETNMIISFCLKGYRQGPHIISRKPACKNQEFTRDQSQQPVTFKLTVSVCHLKFLCNLFVYAIDLGWQHNLTKWCHFILFIQPRERGQVSRF